MDNTEYDYYKRHGLYLSVICWALIALLMYEYKHIGWAGFLVISIIFGIMSMVNIIILILEKLGKFD